MEGVTTIFVMLMVVFALSTPHPLELQQDHLQDDNPQISKPVDDMVENQRTKRQYFYYPSWSPNAIIRVPSVQSYYYQIKRPYVIPVWGAEGSIPIYLPPQPLYINPGYPSDNPPKKYPGLPYLPPDKPGTENSTNPTETKFGDGPVWDHVSGSSSTTVRPTRRTKRPGQQPVTSPPLVHRDSTTSAPETVEKSAGTPIGALRPSAGGSARPAPVDTPKDTPILTNQPSRCVWAIISCCSANSNYISYSCFEQLGCTGAFWGTSPCESEFARSAISAAMNYYSAK